MSIFYRSQLNSAAEGLTVEQRLQSNKKNLQRSHGYMDKNFAAKWETNKTRVFQADFSKLELQKLINWLAEK